MIPVIPNLEKVLAISRQHKLRLYGWRNKHPITRLRTWHNGIDLTCKQGTPIFAPFDGFIYKFSSNARSGNYIKLRHPQHPEIFETAYVHLHKFASILMPGPEKITVQAGDVIGYVGSTGKSTGPHLHFIIRLNKRNLAGRRWRRDVDPLPYLTSSLSS